jgi:hypothetical protein
MNFLEKWDFFYGTEEVVGLYMKFLENCFMGHLEEEDISFDF